jgi:hypothetical protein
LGDLFQNRISYDGVAPLAGRQSVRVRTDARTENDKLIGSGGLSGRVIGVEVGSVPGREWKRCPGIGAFY